MRAKTAIVAAFFAAQLTAAQSRAQSTAEQDPTVDGANGDEYADTDPSALSDFRAALDPFGTWAEDPTYGTVWAPGTDQVDTHFQPYDTAGSWNYVDGDYVWVSDYAWGWVCFHYGRWAVSAGRWVWVPGRDYAGAWVTWRVGDESFQYVGWAPLAPSWIWVGGSATALGFSPTEPWVSSPNTALLSPGAGWQVIRGDAVAPFAIHTRPYVPARPSAAPGPALLSAPHGPPPSILGIEVSRLAMSTLSARELRARLLAHPSTAQRLGARPPVQHVVAPMPQPFAAQPLQRKPPGDAHASSHARR
jgi:hypothetical protein